MFKRSITPPIWDMQQLIAYLIQVFWVFPSVEGINNREVAGLTHAEELGVGFTGHREGLLTLGALIFHQSFVELSRFPRCFHHVLSPYTTQRPDVIVRRWFGLPFSKGPLSLHTLPAVRECFSNDLYP